MSREGLGDRGGRKWLKGALETNGGWIRQLKQRGTSSNELYTISNHKSFSRCKLYLPLKITRQMADLST